MVNILNSYEIKTSSEDLISWCVKGLLQLVVCLKFKMQQWCNCLTNLLQSHYYHLMNPQYQIAAYQAIHRYKCTAHFYLRPHLRTEK